jgi:uncharacterized protein (TIGR02118 family)
MHKLVVLIRRSDDPETLERRWSEEFVPLAEKMPGLRRVVVSRVVGGPAAPPGIQLIHEFLFADLEALLQAMVSPEGQAAGRVLMGIASREAELIFAEHLEMEVQQQATDSEPRGG